MNESVVITEEGYEALKIVPDIGSQCSTTYRQTGEKGTLRHVTTDFNVTVLDVTDGFNFVAGMVKESGINHYVNTYVIGDYGLYEYLGTFSGEPKTLIRLNDPSNVWFGTDYATTFTQFMGVFKKDGDVWWE